MVAAAAVLQPDPAHQADCDMDGSATSQALPSSRRGLHEFGSHAIVGGAGEPRVSQIAQRSLLAPIVHGQFFG
jgi:hypothetical protein